MFIKKEITRQPDFYNHQHEIKKFKNCFEITAGDEIISAYETACGLTKNECVGYDAIKIKLNRETYEIAETLILNKKTKSGLPIVFESDKNCLISGSISFKGGFEPHKNGVYKRKLNDNITGFRQLYAGGKLCTRSSFPKRSENYRTEFIKGKWIEKERAIEIPVKLNLPENTPDLEIIAVEKWTCSVVKIKKTMQKKSSTVFYLDDLSASLFFDEQRSTKLNEPMFRIENALDLVTAQNEWYFDRKSKLLYYKPSANTDINNIEFTVPVLEKIIEVKQNSVFFENISLGYSNWDYPSQYGFAEVQGTRYIDKSSDSNMSAPAAAVSVYSNDVHFNKCKIFNTGGAGISFYDASGIISVTNCSIDTTGAGGISVGSFDEKIPPQKNILIFNNTIKNIGMSYLGGVAVLAGYTKNLIIDRNTIQGCGYTGISVGWGWGRENDMGNFTITNNHVSDIVNNYLFDGAGLYLLGRQNGSHINLISGNYFEGGNGYAGLYFDEYSNNYAAHDNVIMSGKKNGWFLLMHDVGYGNNTITVENNIIETKKKFINSYQMKNNGERPFNKKSSPKKRNVFVRNNYTNKYKNFDKIRSLIINNCGAK